MGQQTPRTSSQQMLLKRFGRVPALFQRSGPRAVRRIAEFLVACIRNKNTRDAYARDLWHFADWCDSRGVPDVAGVSPIAVAAYVEELGKTRSKPTVKRRLSAIRRLMDWLVTGHIVEVNPAWSVQGPRYVVTKGSTPVLSADEVVDLIDSIPVDTVVGLRDRALISIMLYSFARVTAASQMMVQDYFTEQRQRCFRLHEKGGRPHVVKAHRMARIAVEAYIRATGLAKSPKSCLFQTVDATGQLTGRPMKRNDAYRMVVRRVKAAGLPAGVCCHSFRATGITEFRRKGGDIRMAARIANHASVRTTQLYDRTLDDIPLAEIERVDF